MKGDHLGDRLDAFLDGELSPAEREEAASHLAACSECRERHEELLATTALLRGAPAPKAPPQFAEELLSRLATRPRFTRLYRLAPLVAAAALLVIALLTDRPSSAPGPESAVRVARDEAAGEPAAPGEGPVHLDDDRFQQDGDAGVAAAAPSPLREAEGGRGDGEAAFGTPAATPLRLTVEAPSPDAAAGVVLAELQNVRARMARVGAPAPADGPCTLSDEKVVAGPNGEPERLVLCLTGSELSFVRTVLERRVSPPPPAGPAAAAESSKAGEGDAVEAPSAGETGARRCVEVIFTR